MKKIFTIILVAFLVSSCSSTPFQKALPTAIATPIPPTPTLAPSLSKPFLCLKSIWPLALHERPGPTLSNIPLGQSVDPGSIIPIEGLLANPEGEWAQVNPWTWFAVTLNPTAAHPTARTFAVQTACP